MNKERENFFVYLVGLAALIWVKANLFVGNVYYSILFLWYAWLVFHAVFYVLTVISAINLVKRKDKVLGWSALTILLLYGLAQVAVFVSGLI